jgi:hypothetical protein
VTTTTGRVTYTGRAFEQDASLAMGGDIVRALVELVTNADDAYGSSDGDIHIDVVRSDDSHTTVTVRDLAKGLSPEQLEQCFGVLGGRTSGFETGAQVRGLLGRGAKDTAAFGRTVFETIKNGVYGRFELDRTGEWRRRDEPVNAAHRDELEIPEGENGLVAAVHVEQPGIEVIKNARLVERLADHVQLRRITTERTVVFRPVTNGRRSPTQMIRWNEPASEPLIEIDLDIDGYDSPAHLRLFKLTSPADGRVGPLSRQGIEVRGVKATYDNTFFGETAPETAWIRGVVDCPLIDDLIRSYDDTQGADPRNPTRLLRRDRDGLDRNHPFTRALGSAVLVVLTPILEDLRPPKDTTGGGKELREDLQRACRDIAQLMKADLDLIDDDPHKGGTTPTAASPLILIPPRLKMAPDSKRSLTILIHDTSFPDGIDLRASASPASSLEVLSLSDPQPHAVYPDTSIATIRVEAKGAGDVTLVVADRATEHTASSNITIQEAIVEPDPPPEALEWRSRKMSVTVEKTRSIRLRSPIDLAPTGRLDCRVSLDGDACELLDSTVVLELTDAGWLEGTCKVRGLIADQRCTITAVGAGTEAIGVIRVSRPAGIGGLGTEIEILDESHGSQRGRVESTDTGYLINVFGRHSGLTNMLGRRNKNGSFQHEQERHVRIAICEAIASIIADWLLAREAERYPHDFRDVDAMFVHRNKNVARYLGPLQQTVAS